MVGSSAIPGGELAAIYALLQSMPTKADIQALRADMKEMHKKDFQEIKGELAQLAVKVTSAEVESTAVENRLTRLEEDRGQ